MKSNIFQLHLNPSRLRVYVKTIVVLEPVVAEVGILFPLVAEFKCNAIAVPVPEGIHEGE